MACAGASASDYLSRPRACEREDLVPGRRCRSAVEQVVAHRGDLAGGVRRERPLASVERVRGVARADRVGRERCQELRGQQLVERRSVPVASAVPQNGWLIMTRS